MDHTVQPSPVPPLSRADALGILLSAASLLLLSWLHSRHTIFWSDEIMGWLVLRQPTLRQLLHAWWAGADSSGIFFYLFARPWLALFGASSLALRLFTASGVAASLALLWLCARRFYRFGVVAAILPSVFLLPPVLLWQLANARTYGILLASVALAAFAFALTDPFRPLTLRLLALTFAAHLLLTGSHILGPVYSAVFVAGLLGRDLWFGRLRPRLYLAAALGWLLLLLSYRNILATAALGKPSFWTLKPYSQELLLGLSAFDPKLFTAWIILVSMAVAAWAALRPFHPGIPLFPRASLTQLSLIATFLGCAITLFAISRVTTSVFVDRYLLPMVLGVALVLCEAATRLLELFRINTRARQILFALMLLNALRLLRIDRPIPLLFFPQTDYTPDLAALIPPDTPAVLTDPGLFAEMAFYQNRSATLLTPVDWPIALDPASGPGAVSGAHEMANWKLLGFYSDQIQPTAQVLAANPRFLVVSPAAHTSWMDLRILNTHRFCVQDLGLHAEAAYLLHLWLVSPRSLPCPEAPLLTSAPA